MAAHHPYGLNFEALEVTTSFPRPNSDLQARIERRDTLNQLTVLGVSDALLAQTCQVKPDAVRRWHNKGVVAHSLVARRALDRLGPIIVHMRGDLALDDEEIGTFLQNQTKRATNDLALDAFDIDETDIQPLISFIAVLGGVKPMASRLHSLYFPRYQDLPGHTPRRAPF